MDKFDELLNILMTNNDQKTKQLAIKAWKKILTIRPEPIVIKDCTIKSMSEIPPNSIISHCIIDNRPED